jgi:ribosomal protein L32
MPCYRCGVRQKDPERGKSPWRRGVRRDQLVLVCPGCQESGDWAADLESCGTCGSVHLIRRLGQVECLDCGLVREPAPVLVSAPTGGDLSVPTPWVGGDDALAEEVGRALDRLLGRG